VPGMWRLRQFIMLGLGSIAAPAERASR